MAKWEVGCLFDETATARKYVEEFERKGVNCELHWDANSAVTTFIRKQFDLLFLYPYVPQIVVGSDVVLFDDDLDMSWHKINTGSAKQFPRNVGVYLTKRIRGRTSANRDTPIVVACHPSSSELPKFRRKLKDAGADRFYDESQINVPNIVRESIDLMRQCGAQLHRPYFSLKFK